MPTSPLTYSRPDLSVATPASADEAAETIRQSSAAGRAVLVRGGGTKWSAGRQPDRDSVIVSTAGLTGITEYEPGELTLTAKAGTPLHEIEAALNANGQYFPFDPPFASYGATLGGMVAAGLSGPRRMRYGGVRDFVIGITYLNDSGETIRSGGKVVKNAAGYDFSKLFCGSLGTLGVMTEISFKVFPQPQGSRTILAALRDAQSVQAALRAIQHSALEVSAADAWPTGTLADVDNAGVSYTLAVQIEGALPSLAPRVAGLRSLLALDGSSRVIEGSEESALWGALRDLGWIGDVETVLRLSLPPSRLAEVDALLAADGARRIFSVAGNVGWAALSGDPQRLAARFKALEVRAMIWRCRQPCDHDIIPDLSGAVMVKRVKQAFDPNNIFYPGRYSAG